MVKKSRKVRLTEKIRTYIYLFDQVFLVFKIFDLEEHGVISCCRFSRKKILKSNYISVVRKTTRSKKFCNNRVRRKWLHVQYQAINYIIPELHVVAFIYLSFSKRKRKILQRQSIQIQMIRQYLLYCLKVVHLEDSIY